MNSIVEFFVDRWMFFVVFGIFLVINLPLVPFQIRYLREMKYERERYERETGKSFDINEYNESKSFERSQMEFNQQGGLFFLSMWIAGAIIWYQDRKEKRNHTE